MLSILPIDAFIDLRNLALPFLSSIKCLPVSGLLLSETGPGSLRSDLLKLISAVASSEFDFGRIKPLLNVALSHKPENTLIWDQVYNAITESTPPSRPIPSHFQYTPWLHHTSGSENSSENRQDMDSALKLELNTFYVGLRHFRQTILWIVASVETAFEAVFKKYMEGSNPLQMNICDTLLDLDLSPVDCYYRLRRDDNDGKRVIYVHITDISILPEDSRTSNDELIRALSKLSGWYDKWDTLTVSRLGDGVRCLPNRFKAHALPPEKVVEGYPFFDILNLRVVSQKKSRVTYVDNGSELCYLKVARFNFELRRMLTELEAIYTLAERKSQLGPELVGYAFEGSRHRVIGFLTKAISGRPARISDMEDCKRALRELHASGLLHGDLVKDNILITSKGPKFIDFEHSSPQPGNDLERWNAMKDQELYSLEAALLDSSGKGRPWD